MATNGRPPCAHRLGALTQIRGKSRNLTLFRLFAAAQLGIRQSHARWENIRKAGQADDIKVKLDDVLESLENQYSDKLKGQLPRIYAGSRDYC